MVFSRAQQGYKIRGKKKIVFKNILKHMYILYYMYGIQRKYNVQFYVKANLGC